MRTFRRVLVCLVVLLAFFVPTSAQTPVATPADAIGVDYPDAWITQYAVQSFQVQWDGGAWVSIGMPQAFKFADTVLGSSTYKAIPPFTSGTHTFNARAVNAAGPGAPMATPFAFAVIGSAPAGVLSNARVVPR